MSERRSIEVPRTARFFLNGPSSGAACSIWFLLHGYGQLAEPFLESLGELAAPARLLVAPEALSRFYLRRGTGTIGASWMTSIEREVEIRDNIRYLDSLWEHVSTDQDTAPRVELTAFGFSQGGAGAARWAVLGQAPVAEVILWGCPLPPDLDLAAQGERARRLRWTFVLGDADEAIDREAWESGLRRLRAGGIEPHVLRFAGGHEVDPASLAALTVR